MVLMVFFSSMTSPRASTVIFFERSPLATAVVTSAMFRTWRGEVVGEQVDVVGQVLPGAGDAGNLGLRAELSFDADGAATLVTCSAKIASVLVMLLRVSASAAISPLAATVSFGDRSPLATAVTTLTMPRTWVVRFDAMKLTLSVRSFQTPRRP